MAVRDRLGTIYAGGSPPAIVPGSLAGVRVVGVCDCMGESDGNRVDELLSFVNSDYFDPKKIWISVHDCRLLLEHFKEERSKDIKRFSEIISEGWDT